ncbi:MAG: GNAT family N-acetyltransferase [Eggerthellaceae bacterium]|nr:GNAT family N-acetyltransferase [Eggerthellaceae bacterium]
MSSRVGVGKTDCTSIACSRRSAMAERRFAEQVLQAVRLVRVVVAQAKAAADEGLLGRGPVVGEPDYWDQGIGTAFLRMMASYLKACKEADRILLDPRKTNGRAIRAYQKAGFSIVKSLPAHELHEGKEEDCWLMERVLNQGPTG